MNPMYQPVIGSTPFAGPLRRRRNQIIDSRYGLTNFLSSTSPRTWGITQSSPGVKSYDAMRVHFKNHGTATPTINGAIAATETISANSATTFSQPIVGGASQAGLLDSTTSPYGWRTLTFSGSVDGVMTAAATSKNPTILTSDWIPIKSVPSVDLNQPFPYAMVRACHKDGATQAYTYFASIPTANATPDSNNRGKVTGQYSVGGGGTLNLASTSSSFDPTSIPIMIEYRSMTSGHTIMAVGDSNTQQIGAGAAPEVFDTWGHRLAASLATNEMPVGYINCGISGGTSAEYYAAFLTHVAAIHPTVVICPLITPNDTAPTGSITKLLAQIQAGRHIVAQIKSYCEQNNILPVFTTWLPNASATGLSTSALDAVRLALNVEYGNDPTMIICDTASILGNGASPQGFKTEYYNNDGLNLHFNGGAGSNVVADALQATISKYL